MAEQIKLVYNKEHGKPVYINNFQLYPITSEIVLELNTIDYKSTFGSAINDQPTELHVDPIITVQLQKELAMDLLQKLATLLIPQQQQCCCETQKELLRMSGADQLAICEQTNSLNNTFNNGLNQVRSDLQQLGYALSQSTSAIIQANNNGVQQIKDLCNNHWNQDLQQKYNDAKVELSQNQQTLALTTQLNAIAAAIAKIPVTATASA